ncbi:unknown [Feldmannia species virus]|uniref:Uncharacterized protein n=1 Tax=Feldmannia species virus TaxID=39420 RepID=B5LWH3_9PHYC|nr:hypothetical protein FeldSpV_gp084 [Feldmannia species virus]ACH46836.1 unknown [Feldmannia species virus]
MEDSRNYEKVLCLIAGGFVEQGSQCVVVVEGSDKPEELQMSIVKSITPDDDPDVLMKKLASESKIPLSKISVAVYAICGGIRGDTGDPTSRV